MVSAFLALARGLRPGAACPFRRVAMEEPEMMACSRARLDIPRGTERSRTWFEEDASVALLWRSSKSSGFIC